MRKRFNTGDYPKKKIARKNGSKPFKFERPVKNIRTLTEELKFLDMAKGVTALTAPTDATGGEMDPSSGCTGCLSAPAQGDGANQRDGNKIIMKNIYITGNITCDAIENSATAKHVGTVFIALVMDTQTNGAQLNSEDVFTNPSALSLNATIPLRNMSFTSRFVTLKTVKLVLPQPSMGGQTAANDINGLVIPFSLSKKLNHIVKFQVGATTANVTAVTDNSLHLIAYSDKLGLVQEISYNARLRFIG